MNRTLSRRLTSGPWMLRWVLSLLLTVLASNAAHAQVMVFAPHPDDEALATSGIIYAAKQAGKTVKVVVATNGDCEVPSIGHVRELETMSAMTRLGLASDDVIFLGYPDCGLRELYYYYTTTSSQYTSAAGLNRTYGYEGLGHTDFHSYMFGSPAPYNRPSLLQDLTALLQYFKPQDVYVTSVWDENTDHYALNYLVSEAILPLILADSTFQPTVHDTLVHEPCELCNPNYQWPMPTFQPTQPFPKPPFLDTNSSLSWSDIESVAQPAAMVTLTPSANLKSLALSDYATQSGGGPWAQSFVRSNEFSWPWELWANLALRATASSSSFITPGTAPDRLNDGEVVGFPRVYLTRGGRGEWVSNNQLAGAWAQLTWTTPQPLTRLVLHDRPDTTENITAGTLTFSDGSSIAVGALPVNGAGLTVTFAQKSVTWVRFTATSAVGTAAGLAELEAYTQTVAKNAWQAPPANQPPTITGGPTASPATITSTDTAALSVTASDPDGNALSYQWVPSAGSIEGTGATVTYVPPTVAASTPVRVDVYVSDSRFGLVSSFVNLTVTPSNQPVNVAPLSVASASSENAQHGQTAAKAIDGIVDGYPTFAQAEWATLSQLAGAWIQLTWSSPQTIGRSILHDRINTSDQIRGGLLRFSDGTTVTVGALPNDGSGLITDFPARTVTWIRFEVTSAVGDSAGLAEWEVFNTPGAANNTAPQITAGPSATPPSITDAGTATIAVTAVDTDGDPLTYSWSTTGGTLTGTGASITFTPPAVSSDTTFRVSLLVTDGRGGAATGFVDVLVSPSGQLMNLAPSAIATASAENEGTGQVAAKAIDGIVDGYPTQPTAEWVAPGTAAGQWIQLTWSTAQSIDSIVLNDRINTEDNIRSGRLTFSDGSWIDVGTLPNTGADHTVIFPNKSVTWVRFTINTAVGYFTGLAEFKVFRGSASADRPPVISAGPTATPSTVASGGTSAVSVTASDVDGDTLSYAWSATAGTMTASGATATFTAPAVSTQTVVTVSVQVTDGLGGVTTGSVNITVNPSNQAPQITAGPTATPATITDSQTSNLAVTATDADGDPLTYVWTTTGGTLTGTGAARTFTPPAVTTATLFTIGVQVSDGQGGATSASVDVLVNTSNVAPTIGAGPTATPATIFSTQTSALSVTASDSNGDPLTYTWSTTGGTLSGTGATRTFTPPAVAATTVYTVTVQVTDGRGGSASGSVNITVNPNSAPTVSAGPTATPATIFSTQTSALSVTASDANGDPLTYTWSTTAGSLAGTGATRTFTPPAVASATTVTVTVVITDGKGGSTTRTVNVIVNPNSAPVVTAGPTSTPAAIFTTQTAALSVTATDANGDALTYTWSTTGGTLSGTGATRTLTPPAVTVVTTLTITVVVTDGKSTPITRTVNVTVTPNTAPTVSAGPTATPATIFATQTSALSVTSSDANGDPLTYTWSATAGTLSGTGSTRTFTPPAVAGATTVTITVVVSDGKGGSVTRTVNVTVNPNSAPTVTAGPTATPAAIFTTQTSALSVTATDANGDPLTYTWSTTGGTLSGTGATRTLTPPAVTVVTTVTVTVVITDGKGGSVTRTVNVTVTPNSAPTVSAGPTATPSTIYATQTSALSVTASDANGDPLTYTWTATTGTLSGTGATRTYTPPAVLLTTTVTITVVISDGKGGSVTRTVNVTVNPNSAPTILSGPTATPSTIRSRQTSTVSVTATDPNLNPLTYTWSTTGGTLSGTGSTRTFTAPTVTATTVYTVTVTVSDGRGGTVTRSVNITVNP